MHLNKMAISTDKLRQKQNNLVDMVFNRYSTYCSQSRLPVRSDLSNELVFEKGIPPKILEALSEEQRGHPMT